MHARARTSDRVRSGCHPGLGMNDDTSSTPPGHDPVDHSRRAKTIAANGDIVPKPYGPSRWASPRRYACAHPGCGEKAVVVKPAGAHEGGLSRAHNCCCSH